MARRTILMPPTLVPRGLSREEAAAYLGIGTTLFDDLVKLGQMPDAKKLKGAVRWDRLQLDCAFEKLPSNGEGAQQGDDEQKPEDDPWSKVRA
ncbi:hypothetical protein [Aminobacter carboxidus]|uniref:Uncharacterized protein n=1 Tax=Aminobacter carboxidus TaxID=376165 RepID=A0ABR9GWV8_9HYPH|nr:hypothetical protein [Aminobacter carboxidus]MBE1208172.1 hypothetical protein [Aminobacter carboxidus]